MKNQFIGYLLLTTLALAQGCSNNNRPHLSLKKPPTDYHKINFAVFIGKHKNDSLDYYEELLANKEFVNVLEHGEYYKNEVNNFLKRGDFTNMQVGVCICVMQKLNVHDYVKLCNIILALYTYNKVPEGLLQDAISPDFLHGLIIIDNYKEADVVALLTSIENDKKVTNKDFRAGLPDILFGKSSRKLKKFYDGNRSD